MRRMLVVKLRLDALGSTREGESGASSVVKSRNQFRIGLVSERRQPPLETILREEDDDYEVTM
jgi:hypothetical protein